MSIKVPISIGELWDKYSILLIKKDKIIDENKLKHVCIEINYLDELMNNYSYKEDELFFNLKDINEKLWDIEDKLRIKELKKDFDEEFIKLARAVYYTNDKRSVIKTEINKKYNSNIYEVKNYVNYE